MCKDICITTILYFALQHYFDKKKINSKQTYLHLKFEKIGCILDDIGLKI